jgi:hypothetical protein
MAKRGNELRHVTARLVVPTLELIDLTDFDHSLWQVR